MIMDVFLRGTRSRGALSEPRKTVATAKPANTDCMEPADVVAGHECEDRQDGPDCAVSAGVRTPGDGPQVPISIAVTSLIDITRAMVATAEKPQPRPDQDRGRDHGPSEAGGGPERHGLRRNRAGGGSMISEGVAAFAPTGTDGAR
jgi:hypothetical protein